MFVSIRQWCFRFKTYFPGCILSLATLQLSAQSNLIQATDLALIKQPGTLSISADGSKAVFTLLSTQPDEKNKWEYNNQTQIWMVLLDGKSEPRPITAGRENAYQPVLSPDGNTVVFVRNADQKPQLFMLQLNAAGEAQQLTRHPNGVSSPQWSPDGKKIWFTSNYALAEVVKDSVLNAAKKVPAWSAEKPAFAANEHMLAPLQALDPNGNINEVRSYLLQNEKDNKAKVITKLNFQQEATTSGQMFINHVFMMDPVVGATPVALTSGFTNFSNVQMVPHSQSLLMERPNDTTLHPDRASVESAIYLKTSAPHTFQKLLGAADSSFGNSLVSPSGTMLAFTFGRAGFASQTRLAIVNLSDPANRITIAIDRSVGLMRWTADEKHLYFTTNSNGGVVLYRYTLASQKLEALSSQQEGIGSFDEAMGKIVMVKTEATNPFELYLADAMAKNQQRISTFNHHWLSKKTLSLPEKRSFKNEKGLEVEYWIMKPAHWQPGKKYPAILEIHGGPTAMWGPGESSMWHEFQFYCAKGYAVVYSNPRGSGGYGEAFMQANKNDWGKGPMNDVLTALDKSAQEFEWIDTSRLAVTGGSYAGYLIAYILGHDKRFSAACTQRGVYDLRTFFGEGNAWRLVPNYFGGYPWQKPTYDVLERESPINYVQNVLTPLIIFHGENDLRTGVIQSEQFYKSLKVLGRTVEYVRHPGATHEITRSGNHRQRIDQMLRTWEFFERFIRHN